MRLRYLLTDFEKAAGSTEGILRAQLYQRAWSSDLVSLTTHLPLRAYYAFFFSSYRGQ